MEQREPNSLNSSSLEMADRTVDMTSNLDLLISSMGPPELRILLEVLTHCNQNLLLTCEQTSRFLNIRLKKVEELAASGKLTKNGNGFFKIGDVSKFKFEKLRMEMQGLKEMADIESSAGSNPQ